MSSDRAESDRRTEHLETKTCPFPDCDWETNYDAELDYGEHDAEVAAEFHYEREHAGEVKIQITLESTQLLGERDPEQIRKRKMEQFEDEGYDVAFVRTEVVEEADDHDELNREVPREDP
jgi:hypothetical protein